MLIKSLLQVLNQVLNVAIQVGYTPIICIYVYIPSGYLT